MSFGPLNVWAILLGAVFTMGLGTLWYSQALFGKQWLHLIGKRAEDLESNPGIYLLSAAAALVSATVLNLVVRAFGATTLGQGALIGVLTWFGFCATASLVYTIFGGPPKKVWLIFAAYQFVIYLVEGIVLAIWR